MKLLHILLLLSLLLIPLSHADPIPSVFPYAVITSSQGTSIHLSAEPGERSLIYSNATLHIFAPVNTSYRVYIDDNLTIQNITESAHTRIPLHLSATHHTIAVYIANTSFSFDVLVTRYAISEGAVQELQRLIEIPPWEWSMHEWAVFGDTVFGALLAIPFAMVFARYMIVRKWGGASVIS